MCQFNWWGLKRLRERCESMNGNSNYKEFDEKIERFKNGTLCVGAEILQAC